LSNVVVENLAAWEEAKKEIEKIPDHPNRVPASDADAGGAAPSNVLRDSSATINGL
jgi:sorting nexin-41/42